MGCLAALANLASPALICQHYYPRGLEVSPSVCAATLYPWSNRLLRLESDMLKCLKTVGSSQLAGLAKYREFCYVNLCQILLKRPYISVQVYAPSEPI